MSSERPIAPTIAAKDENQQPLWNSHAEKPSLLPKKLRILSDSERSELFRIDELIEQLHSGAFCQDMDHPYYEKYRDTETQRQRRIQAALKRREYAREMVQREFVATQRQLRLALAEEERQIWIKLRSGQSPLSRRSLPSKRHLSKTVSEQLDYSGDDPVREIAADLAAIRR